MGDFIFNGKYYKEGTAIVGSSNRGLRYGDGVFETIKLKNGKKWPTTKVHNKR